MEPKAVEHNLHRHPYLHYASQIRSGYVFLTRYREAAEPVRRRRRRRAINYTNLHMASGYILLRHYQQPVKPNLQRHPFAKMVLHIQGDQPVARTPYKAHTR